MANVPMNHSQVEYPSKRLVPLWDNVNIEHPVKKFPETAVSSKEIAHQWWPPPDVVKKHLQSLKASEFNYDFRIRDDLMRSQTAEDFGYKAPETVQFCKHSSALENHYIYPPSKNLEEGLTLTPGVHGTTEMRDAYKVPITPARLATRKQQYEHPFTLSYVHHPSSADQSLERRLERLDTTYDGYEKYLDIYLTSNRLHHRPFTADQLSKPSNSNDVVTYYTYSDIPRVRRKKLCEGEWWLPIKWPKPIIDREKYKQPPREIIVHQKLKPVPGAYRTEVRDNYNIPNLKPLFLERRQKLKCADD